MARPRLLPGTDARQGLVALALNSTSSLIAGAALGALTDTFERYPGLLPPVPAPLGLRGNVFGALRNRATPSIHAGAPPPPLRAPPAPGPTAIAPPALTTGM